MGHSQYDSVLQERRAWNAGKKVGAKRALKPRQTWTILFFLDREARLRDRPLCDLAIDSKLRGLRSRESVGVIGLRPEEYGTHSLRRTKGSIIYKATGNPEAVQILLGHTKIENTGRYLGVDMEDAPALAGGTKI